MVVWYHATLPPCYLTIWLPYHLAIMVISLHGILVAWYATLHHTTMIPKQPRYQTIRTFCHDTILLAPWYQEPYYHDTILPWYHDTCGVWYGVWYVVCGMWCVWYVVCGMWYVVCEVCGVWYVVSGVAGCRLLVAGCRLQVTGSSLQLAQ
jgi:hypothetical protein